MIEPNEIPLRTLVDTVAARVLYSGVSRSDLVKELLGCAAALTVAEIGWEGARQYFATVALEVFKD